MWSRLLPIAVCALLFGIPFPSGTPSGAGLAKAQGIPAPGMQQRPRLRPTEEPAGPAKGLPATPAQPVQMQITRSGNRLFLETGSAPDRVELWAEGKLLSRIPGAGKTRFDIAPFARDIPKGLLVVHAYDRGGGRSTSNFDITAHQRALGITPEGSPEVHREAPRAAPGRLLPREKAQEATRPELGTAESVVVPARPSPEPSPPEPGLSIAEPRAGQIFRLGGSIPIRMKLTQRAKPGDTYTLRLHRRTVPGPGIPMYSGRVRDLPADGVLPPWPIPVTTFAATDYFIRATAGELSGDSSVFAIGTMGVLHQVISPNGGERWGQGAAHEIVWSGGRDAHVWLLRDGRPWERLLGEVHDEAGDRNHRLHWFIRTDLDVGSNYRIRVTNPATGQSDESDADFSIRRMQPGDSSILVKVDVGENKLTKFGLESYLDITTYCDDARCRGRSMSYQIQSPSTDYTPRRAVLSTSTCNRTHSYPMGHAPSADDYHATVVFGACFGVSDRFVVSQARDVERGLQRLRIEEPRAGVTWHPGTSRRIEWYGPSPQDLPHRITLMNRYQEVLDFPVTSIQHDRASGRSYIDWTVPETIHPRSRIYDDDQFAIRVHLGPPDGPVAQEAFSGFFRIPKCDLVFTQPAPGATYFRLNFLPVAWRYYGDCWPASGERPLTVILANGSEELYGRDGRGWYRQVMDQDGRSPAAPVFLDPDVVAEEGAYWLHRVRFDSWGNARVLGSSEPFQVTNPTLNVTSPRGAGLVFRAGEPLTVTWRTEGLPPGSGVRGTAELVLPSGVVLTICDDLDLNRGSFTWNVREFSRCPGDPEPRTGSGWGSARGIVVEGSSAASGPNRHIRITINRLSEVWAASGAFDIE